MEDLHIPYRSDERPVAFRRALKGQEMIDRAIQFPLIGTIAIEFTYCRHDLGVTESSAGEFDTPPPPPPLALFGVAGSDAVRLVN